MKKKTDLAKKKAYNEKFYSDPANLEAKKKQERDLYWSDPVRRAERLAYTRAWKKRHPDVRHRYNCERYNITPEYFSILESHQGGVCAICKKPQHRYLRGVLTKLNVDHDHDSGKVRGLLCSNCNRSLGLLGDNVETLLAAADYLQHTTATKVEKTLLIQETSEPRTSSDPGT